MRRLLIFLILFVSYLPFSWVVAQTPTVRASITYIVDQEVSPADESLIREGFTLAQDFAFHVLDVDEMGSFVVEIRGDDYDDRFVGYANSNHIITQPNHPLWVETYPPLRRQQHPVHEYFHLVQEELSGTTNPVQMGPVWMLEGTAEYFGWLALEEAGIVSSDEVRLYHMANVTHDQTIGPLMTYETGTDLYRFGSSYSLSALGVEMLVERAGISSLADFYRGLKDGSWSDSFTAAFDFTPTEFYALFEENRLGFGNFDSTNPFLGSLEAPAPATEGQFDITFTVVPESVERGSQATVIGTTAAGATCNLDVTTVGGNEILSYDATADTLGKIFWLWTIEEDLDPNAAIIEVACGGIPISTEIEIT